MNRQQTRTQQNLSIVEKEILLEIPFENDPIERKFM